MIFAAIILLGVISWIKLPQELFPSISYPQITVVTAYENAAPEEIESLITKVVEEACGTVNNVKRISSVSKEGKSLVMVEFNWGTNMDFAALNVREKIDLIKERLPREAQDPVVMKFNPFDLPIMNLAVTGPQRPVELREICRKYLKDSIEKVEGVASATITGGEEREIVVEISQGRLRASQISIVSIVESLKSANLNYPAGTIKESFYEYLIRTMGEYQNISEIQETPAALDIPEERAKTLKEKEQEEQKGRRLIYLKDIATVRDGTKELTSISRYNGKDSISLVIRKQSGANSIKVAEGVKKEISILTEEKLARGIDTKGIEIRITYDQSDFIKSAIGGVRDAGIQGGILSFMVLFLFLWEWIAATIITAAIPICVTATVILMYFSGINLNMMSLGGLAMGVGMVVDNANVVIENVIRHQRQLKKPMREAVIDGTSEMIAPIIGSTLTTIAVFLPFAFVTGIAGQIFKQLSFTISFSMIASILVAVSLVPVLYVICGQSKKSEKILAKVDAVTKEYTERFKQWNTTLVDRRYRVVGIILALFGISLIVLLSINRQFMPKVDQRQFIIKVDLEPGSKLEITDRVVRKIERKLLRMPETKDVTVNIGSPEERGAFEQSSIQTLGSNQAQILINLKSRGVRFLPGKSTDDIIQELKSALEKEDMEKAQIDYIAQETSLGSAATQGAPIAIEVKGPDLNKLGFLASTIQSKLKRVSGVYGVKNNQVKPSPEAKLNIRKDKASIYGLSVRDIAVTTQVALKGYVATKFKDKTAEDDIDIRVRLRPEDRNDMNTISRLLVHSPMGMDIPMSELAYMHRGKGPTEINRIDQQRSITITANVFKRNFTDVAKDITSIIDSLKLSGDYSVDLTGEQQNMKESFASLAFALTLAILLVYMIMAGEFESLWQPLLIMFTVPLALIGVAFALLFTLTPLSVVAALGIIMLGGIAVNNGIVLIEFINYLRSEGWSPKDAVIEASKTRLRPILMTSATTILGLVPLALGIGEGAELQAPLALTVLGGLTTSTFLTLVFIPCLYVIIIERLPFLDKLPEKIEIPSSEEAAARPSEDPAATAASAEEIERLKVELQANVQEKETEIARLKEQLYQQQASLAAASQETDTSLVEIRKQLEAKETEIETYKKQVDEQRRQFEALTSGKDFKLRETEKNLQDRNRKLQELEQQLDTQKQAYNATAAEKEKQLEIIKQQLAEKESSLSKLQAEQAEKQAALLKVEHLEREAAQARAQAAQEARARVKAEQEAKANAEALEKARIKAASVSSQKQKPAEKPIAPPAAPAPVSKKTGGLNPRQTALIEKLKTIKRITRKEYSEMFAISIPTAARDLKDLTDKNILTGKGPLGPGRWYEFAE
jgi:HAE1 family hydrophobic/amphiphilic exporter-1